MSSGMSPEIAEVFRRAAKEPLLAPGSNEGEPLLDRSQVERLLPHRDPFLLIDRVTSLDLKEGLIAARYDLSAAGPVFAGHFPHHPVWPGVLQIEAVGQAGILLHLKRSEGTELESVALTHVLQARFIREVTPGGDVEILARVFEDGLFFTIVGQCLRDGEICSAAAVSGL